MKDYTIPKHTVIQYVRDKKGVPYGVVVAVKVDDGYRLGYSLCNKKDRFSKDMALKIALGRALWSLDPFGMNDIPHPVKKMLPTFSNRCKKYYRVAQ